MTPSPPPKKKHLKNVHIFFFGCRNFLYAKLIFRQYDRRNANFTRTTRKVHRCIPAQPVTRNFFPFFPSLFRQLFRKKINRGAALTVRGIRSYSGGGGGGGEGDAWRRGRQNGKRRTHGRRGAMSAPEDDDATVRAGLYGRGVLLSVRRTWRAPEQTFLRRPQSSPSDAVAGTIRAATKSASFYLYRLFRIYRRCRGTRTTATTVPTRKSAKL